MSVQERRAGRPRDERASLAIASAARRQLAEVGYANLSMESVAAEAGVSRATIYRRYSDKADLVTSAIAGELSTPSATSAPSARPTANDAATEAATSGRGDPLADLVTFLAEFDARIAESCLEIIGSLLGTRADPSAMALHRERVIGPRKAAVVALVVRAMDDGLLREDADPILLTEMLVGAVFARRISGMPAERGWARRAVETICAGVATPSGLARLRTVGRGAAPRGRRPAGRDVEKIRTTSA